MVKVNTAVLARIHDEDENIKIYEVFGMTDERSKEIWDKLGEIYEEEDTVNDAQLFVKARDAFEDETEFTLACIYIGLQMGQRNAKEINDPVARLAELLGQAEQE